MYHKMNELEWNYAGGGMWLASAHVVAYDDHEQVANVTMVIGCGYLNVYDGLRYFDEFCGGDAEPSLSFDLEDLKWRYDEYGDLVDGNGVGMFALEVPYEPYNFYNTELGVLSEAAAALWHWYVFRSMS